jgi:hypothetical protein
MYETSNPTAPFDCASKVRWRRGTAVLLPDDDAGSRLEQLPRFNSAMVRALGTKPLTVRVDLE